MKVSYRVVDVSVRPPVVEPEVDPFPAPEPLFVVPVSEPLPVVELPLLFIVLAVFVLFINLISYWQCIWKNNTGILTLTILKDQS